jgi:hypothetical protein
MRVIVDSVKDCYGALGIIHSLWKPLPGRFKDYVAMPKFNMYQSLHTTVIGPEGQAARDPDPHLRDAPDRRVRRRRALALQGEGEREARDASTTSSPGCGRCWSGSRSRPARSDPREFMETLRIDLFEDEVFVFTPKGEVKSLPPARRRSTSPTPCTPTSAPLRRRQGQRPHRAAALRAAVGRHRRDPHLASASAAPRATGWHRQDARARNKIPAAGGTCANRACRRRRSPARRCSPT